MLEGFMEETSLVADVDRYDESADAVVLMTAHSAKGLEFPYVFLPGMEEGLFPSMQSITSTSAEVEEERRLCYVAITRAKRELFIVHTNQRMLYGRTQFNPESRFLKEIPAELIEREKSPYDKPKKPVYSYGESSSRPVYDTLTINSIPKKPAQAQASSVLSAGDRVFHAPIFLTLMISPSPNVAWNTLSPAESTDEACACAGFLGMELIVRVS